MEDTVVKGTCQTMCPLGEAILRQKENLLHKLEIKEGTEGSVRPQFDIDRVVKCFNRSAAGKETTNPSNLRPFPVLLKTIHYLYKEVFPLHISQPILVYNFMFDRFCAIRQDAVIQNLSSEEIIIILEPITRFLIYFSYVLVEETTSKFDEAINNKHLQECLKRLLVCYDDCQTTNQNNRWEIESAYLLLNLGNMEALNRAVQVSDTFVNALYNNCFTLSLHWYLKNYVRVLKSISELPPLLLCIISNIMPEIRKYSLQAMSCAFSSQNSAYPISHLKTLLLFENDAQVEEECRHFNIKISNGKINFLKKDMKLSVQNKKGIKLNWIDKKLKSIDVLHLLCFGNIK